jgi:hypothetical protein
MRIVHAVPQRVLIQQKRAQLVTPLAGVFERLGRLVRFVSVTGSAGFAGDLLKEQHPLLHCPQGAPQTLIDLLVHIRHQESGYADPAQPITGWGLSDSYDIRRGGRLQSLAATLGSAL